MAKINLRGYEIAQVAISKLELLPIFAMRELKGEDVDSLADSIAAQGLINPLLVRMKGSGYELISGHRRYLALKKLKADTAPAHVIDATDEQAFVLALTENIERRDPTPIEDAQAFQRAIKEMHMKPEAIAKQVGRSPSWVLRRVQLLELEPRIQAAVQEGTVSATMAEEAFLKLKHQGDQLQLLKEVTDNARCGRAPTAKALEQSANNLVKQRGKIEAIANKIHELGDKCKFPVCPKCKGPASPDGWDMDLKKNKVSCSHYHGAWNLVTGPIKDRETTLDGNVSDREKVPGGESVVKVESKDHLSNIAIQDYFDHLAKLVTKARAATMIQIGEEFGDDDDDEELSITFKVDRKKLPKWPTMVVTPPGAKKAKHATDATLQVGGWGGNNEEVLEHRTRLWDLEKAIDAKTQPAGIVRHELERLVVDHVALSKGKVLETTMDNNTVYEVLAVHRDYTAVMHDTTHDSTRFMEEKEIRAIVKNAKKAAKKGG